MTETRNGITEIVMPGHDSMDKEWLTSYWEVFTECVIELNAEYIVTHLMMRAESRFEKTDMVGKSFLDISVDEDKDFIITRLDLLKGNDTTYARFQFLSILNRYFRWTLIPFYEDGVFAGCRGVAVDVTKQTLDERLLEEAREEAEAANAAKSEFLSRMSHEIRTPMNAIIGMISIGLGSDDINRKDYCFQRADNAAKHLLGIINDILDMSKIEADKFELSNNIFDFQKTLSNITNMALVYAEEKHLIFSVNVGDGVPSLILGDELRLSQVMMNLLTNAIKFTPERGTVSLNITMLYEGQEDVILLIEIADNGIGISLEQQTRLFSPFNQADANISQLFGGTGLGLAITKKIVELAGGIIWIESELGEGAKFIFTLRTKKVGCETCEDMCRINELCDTTSGESNESYDFSDYTILIAEDVDINREILSAVLSDSKINIEYAENGSLAVSMYEEDPLKFDLILMDINMPVMDGYEATRQIREFDKETGKNVPIIAMTANVFKEDIEKCLEYGMIDHIGKPIDEHYLFAILKKYLDGRKK